MGKSWSDRLLGGGAFLLFFGAYLIFARGPAANPQQQYFRIGLTAMGVVLGGAGLVMKLRNR